MPTYFCNTQHWKRKPHIHLEWWEDAWEEVQGVAALERGDSWSLRNPERLGLHTLLIGWDKQVNSVAEEEGSHLGQLGLLQQGARAAQSHEGQQSDSKGPHSVHHPLGGRHWCRTDSGYIFTFLKSQFMKQCKPNILKLNLKNMSVSMYTGIEN